jgi:uncharacterized membrane protein YdbT with pleckstrin-like domain
MSEETVVFRGSPSVLTRFGALFIGFLIFAGTVTGALTLKSNPTAMWIFAGLAVAALIYIAGIIIVTKATSYEVTSERIRLRRGIFTKRTDELELYRATDTSLIEPLSLRMLGLASIEIRTSDASTPTVYLYAIRGARDLRETLRKHIEECRERKRVRVTEFEHPEQTGTA